MQHKNIEQQRSLHEGEASVATFSEIFSERRNKTRNRLSARVITVDIDQIQQVVNLLLVTMLDDLVAEIDDVFNQTFKVFAIRLNLLVLWM
jgi:hypothetical protein